MKKLLKSVSFLVLLGVAMLLSRCEKNTDNQPSIVEIPVINLSQSIGSDGMVTVSCTVTNADSVFCNNVYITNYEIRFPACDSILVFVAKNELYKVNKSIQITKPASPTGDVSFTYNGLVVDSLPYPGGEIVATINFANGDLVFNGNTYHKSPVSINLTTIGTEVFDFTIKGICEVITISLVIPVKDLTTREQQIIFGSWYVVHARESYTGPDGPWEETGIDFTAPCEQDNTYKFSATPENGRKLIFDQGVLCSGGISPIFTFDWRLEGDSLFIGDGPSTRFLKSVDWDHMVWIEKGYSHTWNGSVYITVPMWMEFTLYHHPLYNQ